MRAGKDHFKNEHEEAHIDEKYDEKYTEAKEESEEAEEQKRIPSFVTYPRMFITYRWYRPIFTGLLFGVFFIVFAGAVIIGAVMYEGGNINSALEMLKGGYDSFDVYTPIGAAVTLGSIAMMIPSLAIANAIAGGRTFRSYASSRGGWSFGVFIKSLILAAFFVVIPIAIKLIFMTGRTGTFSFTKEGLIIAAILGPMQCIAEEYVFRGLLLQTLGSWFRFPPIAILLSSAAFTALHPYNTYGMIEVFVTAMVFGIIAWMSHGIEAGAALHVAYNMTIFFCTGFGFGEVSSQTTQQDLIFEAAIFCVFFIVMIFCKRFGMFEEVKKNDAEIWNAKKKGVA